MLNLPSYMKLCVVQYNRKIQDFLPVLKVKKEASLWWRDPIVWYPVLGSFSYLLPGNKISRHSVLL